MIPFWLGAGYHMFRESQRGREQSTFEMLEEVGREFDEACAAALGEDFPDPVDNDLIFPDDDL